MANKKPWQCITASYYNSKWTVASAWRERDREKANDPRKRRETKAAREIINFDLFGALDWPHGSQLFANYRSERISARTIDETGAFCNWSGEYSRHTRIRLLRWLFASVIDAGWSNDLNSFANLLDRCFNATGVSLVDREFLSVRRIVRFGCKILELRGHWFHSLEILLFCISCDHFSHRCIKSEDCSSVSLIR